ncbi:Metal-binding protein-like [Syntrophobacter sp. SbD1]|nr:Metal-binding protein-like [Syntrophobacter sp. SbD1]
MTTIRKIRADMNEAQLSSDLEKYRLRALELGASNARIVKAEEIPVDERIPMKCQIPRCFGYGAGAQCPPNTMKPAELRELLKKYESAVFFIKDIPAEVIVRDKATIKERVDAYQQMYTMVSEIESAAFYDGHYLAVGFAAGSCRHTFCGQLPDCQAMKGDKCRFSLKSRPSMEAVGIDVYKMVALAGWDIYPIGSGAKVQDVPKGTLAGIVIVQ